jgi:hypothetical protein
LGLSTTTEAAEGDIVSDGAEATVIVFDVMKFETPAVNVVWSITLLVTVSGPSAFSAYVPAVDGITNVNVLVASVHPANIWLAMTLPVAVLVTMKLYVYGSSPPASVCTMVTVWPWSAVELDEMREVEAIPALAVIVFAIIRFT